MTLDDARSDQLDAIIAALSPAAFRFFLPGLMRLALRPEHDGEMIDSEIVGCLTASDHPSLSWQLAAVQRRIDLLDDDQRRAVAAVCDHFLQTDAAVGEVWRSARENVLSGVVRAYSSRVVAEEVAEVTRQLYNKSR